MPSPYAHEPDWRTLETITRYVSALQRSKVQSCAALFANAHDSLGHHSFPSHARVHGVVKPVHYVSSTREPPPNTRRATTMRRDRRPDTARQSPVVEGFPPPSPLSRDTAQLESSSVPTSMRLEEEDVRAEEYALGRSSDLNATDMGHGGVRHTQSAQSRAHRSFGSSQEEEGSIKGGTNARGTHLPCFETCGASRSASRSSSCGASARRVLHSSAAIYRQQRQPPSPPPSWPQSEAPGATPGPNSHPLQLKLNANMRSNSCRARERRSFTFSLSVSKANDTSRILRADPTFFADGVCNTRGSNLVPAGSPGKSSHPALQWTSDSREQYGGSRPTRWIVSQEARVPFASPLPKPVHKCTSASSVRSSRSPPSVTVAVTRKIRGAASCDTETLSLSVQSAGAYSPPQDSRASVSSCSSCFMSFAGHGGRHSTSGTTTMRRGRHKNDAGTRVDASDGTMALSHTAPAVAVAATAGHFSDDTKQHLPDALHGSSPLPRDPRQEEAERQWLSSSVAGLAHASTSPQVIGSGTHSNRNSTVGPTHSTPPRLACAPRNPAKSCFASASSSLRLQTHPVDGATNAASDSFVQAAFDRLQGTTRAASEKPPLADRASPQSDASSASGLQRYSLPLESAPSRNTSAVAFAANKASLAPFTSRSLLFSPPSTAAAVAADRDHVMSACPSQRQTPTCESANARYRGVSETSIASSRAPASASAHVVILPKTDLSLPEAATMQSDALPGLAAASTCAAHQQCLPQPPLPSPSLASSPIADVQRRGGFPQRTLSPSSTCAVGPPSERREDAPPARTGSSRDALSRCEVSPRRGAKDVLCAAHRRAPFLMSAVAGTRDVARPVHSVAEVEQRVPGNGADRPGQGEEILGHPVGRWHVAPQREAIDTADEPLTEVCEMQGDAAREEFMCTTNDTSGDFSREMSQEQHDLQQHPQQQPWHRYLMYVSPVRGSGASPLSQGCVGVTATRCRDAGAPLSTPLAVFPTKFSPPLAHLGNRRRYEGCRDGIHPSAQSPPNDARLETQEGHDRSESRCPHCSATILKQEKVEVGHVEATLAAAEMPGHWWLSSCMPSLAEANSGERGIANEGPVAAVHQSRRDPPSLADNPVVTTSFPATRDGAVRLKSPAPSHADVAFLRKSEEGSSSYLSGGGALHASDSGSEDFDRDSPHNSTEAHRPRRHRGHSGRIAHNSVTSVLTLSHGQIESIHSVASDFDWVSDDYAAQHLLHRKSEGEGPLAVSSPLNTAKSGSSSALTGSAMCGSSVRSGRVLDSQTLAAPPLDGDTAAAENVYRLRPPWQTWHADSPTSQFALPLCTPSNSDPPHPSTPHQSRILPRDSSPTNSTGSLSADSLASLEHTPLSQSLNADAMESSVTECDAPVTSSFFACDHTTDAALAAAAARKMAEVRDTDVANDARATEGPSLWEDEKAEAHIAEEDDGGLPCSPGEGPSSAGSRNLDPPSRATQPAVRTPSDVSAEAAHVAPSTPAAANHEVAASSQTSRLSSHLLSHSVFNTARCAPTSHAASTAANRRTLTTNRSLLTDLGASREPDLSNGDRVEDCLDDAPTLRDRYAPYTAPVLGVDGCDVYSSVSSASAPPLSPGPLREPQLQPHQQQATFLSAPFSTHPSESEDNVTALQSKNSGQETEGCRAEAGEGSRRGVAPELYLSLLASNAALPAKAPSQLPRGRDSGERKEEKHESDVFQQAYHSQPLRQWHQSKQVQRDDGARPKTSDRALSSSFSARGSRPCGDSVNTQPYDTDRSQGRCSTQDEDKGDPGTIMDPSGGAGESRGEPVALAPSSVQSSEDSRGNRALIRSAAGGSREGRPSSSAYPSIGATVSTTVAKTPGYRPAALQQRTRTAMRTVLSKPPMKSGSNRLWLANGLHRSCASSFNDGDLVEAARETESRLQRQQAVTSTGDNGDYAAGANDCDAEDDEEGGGYCSYGYESDSIQV